MDLLHIQEIVDDRLCYEKVRALPWPEGVQCLLAKARIICGMVITIRVYTVIAINARAIENIMTTWPIGFSRPSPAYKGMSNMLLPD